MPSIGDVASDVARTLYEFRLPVAIVSVGIVILAAAGAYRLGWLAAGRRHPWRTAVAVVAMAAVIAPVGWYLGSPIFIRTSLVEAGPDPVPIASTASLPTASTVAPSAVEPSTAPNASNASPAEPSPSGPVTIAIGEFSGTDDFHFGHGTASLIELEPGRYHLRLDDFSVRNGPDLFVYLSSDAGGYADDAVELGKLKATDGSFGYDLPEGLDPVRFRSALIWCKQFSHLFAVAPFSS